jgi:hypothetical protein
MGKTHHVLNMVLCLVTLTRELRGPNSCSSCNILALPSLDAVVVMLRKSSVSSRMLGMLSQKLIV